MTTLTVSASEPALSVESTGPSLSVSAQRAFVSVSGENNVELSVESNPIQISVGTDREVNLDVTATVISLEIATMGPQGPPGADGAGVITVPFEWNSISILPITIAVADKAMLEVSVCLLEAFNGTGPSLSVGDSADHERLMPSTAIFPGVARTFAVHPGYRYASNTQVNLYITPGSGASAGSGVVSIEVEQ